MTATLPPARDLPPGRQGEIRAALQRSATRRRRSARFGTVAVALAAAATAVVLVLPDEPTSGYWSARPSAISGLPPERVEEIEEGCWKSSRVPERPVLHRYLEDASGELALLYTRTDALACDLDESGGYYSGVHNPGRKGFDTRWLTGHFSVDHQTQRSGDRATKPGNQTVAGRVDSRVARMTYTVFGRTVDAEVGDGTFVVRILHPVDWDFPKEIDPDESLKAYDAEGNLIGDSRDTRGKCYVDWEGEIVSGTWDPGQKPGDCLPAQPWR
ncbi:hypothetical protein SAMN05216188_111207 [Lentzea xinjiangensis]|uniref:Uncharacterized protein n=1 Tax=Lentzea xinjiangensis TaxID=402600 RepID=A0A1H9P9Q6_9PSEU|nr:hypothetical protein [Lentzea xinjiangensis]SER44847.1 hypothetical protein SAMN05216188_111207 [Lentzea xinjiangensis]